MHADLNNRFGFETAGDPFRLFTLGFEAWQRSLFGQASLPAFHELACGRQTAKATQLYAAIAWHSHLHGRRMHSWILLRILESEL